MSLNALATFLKCFSTFFFCELTHRHEGIALPLLRTCAWGNIKMITVGLVISLISETIPWCYSLIRSKASMQLGLLV